MSALFRYILLVRYILLGLLCMVSLICNAQLGRSVPPDSLDIARLEKKNFWRASGEAFGFNIALWTFDRYVQKGQYAYISWNTIKENFRHGFEWDDDHLGTNMFAHPYNGSLFYNAGRSNGYNFWQSTLFGVGGSAMWEMFMEREYPSTNDIIATPIGGAAIGEVLYRTSDLILDDRSTDGERFGRELAAFVVNPMRGFTRIVTGRAWEQRATSGRRFGIPPMKMNVSLGGRLMTLYDTDRASTAGVAAQIQVEYGDRFERKTKAPYDYFSFLVELNAVKSQPILSRMEIVGRLLSTELMDAHKCQVSAGLYQHFDYFDSDTIHNHWQPFFPSPVPYKLGTPASLGVGAMARYEPSELWHIDAYAHANAIVLAGVLNDYYHIYHRNYNWGNGGSLKFGVDLSLFKGLLSLGFAGNMYRLHTWITHKNAIDIVVPLDYGNALIKGNKAQSTFNNFEGKVDLRLKSDLYLTGSLNFYRRFTRYDGMTIKYDFSPSEENNPGIESKQLDLHLMLTYKF